MTLEEEFESDGNYCDNQIYTYGCIKIAERFAIAFWEWRSTTPIKNIDQYTNAEAIKMFKEEKGL